MVVRGVACERGRLGTGMGTGEGGEWLQGVWPVRGGGLEVGGGLGGNSFVPRFNY